MVKIVNNKRKTAVFLGRDGMIIEDRGHLRKPSEVAFLPEALEALQELQKRFLLFIITNQPGRVLKLLAEKEIPVCDFEFSLLDEDS